MANGYLISHGNIGMHIGILVCILLVTYHMVHVYWILYIWNPTISLVFKTDVALSFNSVIL